MIFEVNAMAPAERATIERFVDGGRSTSKLLFAAVAVCRKMSRLIHTIVSPRRTIAGIGPNFILSMMIV